MVRSSIWCRSVSRVIRTNRHSALPYWLAPSTILGLSFADTSAPSVGGVRVRAQQQRHVVVRPSGVDLEGEADDREERVPALLREPGAGLEGESVGPGVEVDAEADPAVGVS